MSSGRLSPTVAPNVGRKRSGCFNSFLRAPRRLNLSSPSNRNRFRPSINNLSNRNRVRPSLSNRSSLRLPVIWLSTSIRSNHNSRSSSIRPNHSIPRNLKRRWRARDTPNNSRRRPSNRPRLSIRKLLGIQRRALASRRNRPDTAAFSRLEVHRHRAHPNRAHRQAYRPKLPASPAIPLHRSNRNRLTARRRRHRSKVGSPIPHRAIRPNSPKAPRPATRPVRRRLPNSPNSRSRAHPIRHRPRRSRPKAIRPKANRPRRSSRNRLIPLSPCPNSRAPLPRLHTHQQPTSLHSNHRPQSTSGRRPPSTPGRRSNRPPGRLRLPVGRRLPSSDRPPRSLPRHNGQQRPVRLQSQ